MPKNFLTAEWRKLIMANYVCDPELLKDFVPAGTELDLYQGRCYVSLVGFMFYNTKVLGMGIPFHQNFEEVNLRFYVRYKSDEEWKRGVVFIKEIVPLSAITFVANTLYKEHYHTMPMRHQIESDKQLKVAYEWKYRKKWNKFEVTAQPDPISIDPNSEEEFITEHYWGYTRINKSKTSEYEVVHPSWQQYPILDYQIDVDFNGIYGKRFSDLEHQKPTSVLLAEGSEIAVNKGIVLS